MSGVQASLRLPAPASSSHWQLGSIGVSHGWHGAGRAPCQGLELLVPCGQPLSVQRGNLEQILRPPFDLLLLPASASDVTIPGFQGWRLSLEAEPIGRLASELSDHQCTPVRCRRRLQELRVVQPRLSPEREIALGLVQLLQICSWKPLQEQGLPERLGMESTLLRMLAMLLCGDLVRRSQRQPTPATPGKARIIEDLLGWIDAHLEQRIALDDLARQSGYSARSLRNIFQERFGCGPVRWIRRRRMEVARERLLNPAGGETVSAIAAACGYPNLSQFSRHFHEAYSLRPSELLREGLRTGP